jgi:arylsulfatase A-like enzyme
MFLRLLLLVPLVAMTAAAMDRPNVILILTDDQGYGDLSAHGNPILKTPNLDQLHAQGVRFIDYTVSPSCAPTRSALLTGRHEFKNGITHTILERERLTLKATTLPQLLQAAGYATGIFGKWHLGDEPAYQPGRRGFDEAFIHGAGGIGQTHPGSCGDLAGNTYFDPHILHNNTFVKTHGYCTDIFFAQAKKWIGTVKDKKPFFCMITPNAPHVPLQVRPEDEARYTGKTKTAAEAKFFGMIANIDDNVGTLLEMLAKDDLEKTTLVIFMNDNGGTAGVEVHNAGMKGKKGTAWRGGDRGASLWRWPGTLTPADCDRLTAHVDVLTTLCELAGVPIPADVKSQVEGRSLVPLLKNPKAEWGERTLFTHVGRWAKGANVNDHKYDKAAVRTPAWRMVAPNRGNPKWQLFEILKDPGEATDVAAQHPAVVRKLAAEYDAWWASLPPYLVNEAAVGPAENSFAELYRKQFGPK